MLCSDLESEVGSTAAFLGQQGARSRAGCLRTKWKHCSFTHGGGREQTTPTRAAPGSSVVRGIPAAKLGHSIRTLSLVEKYSFRGDLKHKHTHPQRKPAATQAGSCAICEENQSAQWVIERASVGRGGGGQAHGKLPGREVHSSPTPGFLLHQVLPFTASPNTSKEVFLYSPGRSVNWPAASKAETLTLKGPLASQGRGEENKVVGS